LPRLIIPLFWLYWVALLPARVMGVGARRRNRDQEPQVGIESGIIGWTHVYFEELLGSAQDFFGSSQVHKQVIDRDQPYYPQFVANQRRHNPNTVVLDVRTPGQNWPRSLADGFRVAWYLNCRGITPIVVLTDAFYRRHRWLAAVLTASHGCVVTFAHTDIAGKIFPHSRIRGPLFMPISQKRLAELELAKARFASTRDAIAPLVIQFIGSMYSPRDEFLQVVQEKLAVKGIELRINSDKAGTSNDDYWRVLVESDIIFTTTLQGPTRLFMDWIWVRQAVFRYAETMAAGTALVAQCVEGGFPYFTKNSDYLEFEGVDQAVSELTALVSDPDLRGRIAETGHATVAGYVQESIFWKVVMKCCQPD
jgi:hypothetical protein